MNRVLIGAAVAPFALAASVQIAHAQARNYVSIVGSSTVYPFATVVAEQFGKSTKFRTPKIESTGSGGGLKLFCAGIGVNHPDITNSSRRIKQSEVERCNENAVGDIIEVKAGYDGIVLANSKATDVMEVSRRDIFLALAREVPNPAGGDDLVPNPYQTWKDVNDALPDRKIVVLGPPPTSGTRDAFAELALEGGCKTFGFIKAMKTRTRTSRSATRSARTAPTSKRARTTTSSSRSSSPIRTRSGSSGSASSTRTWTSSRARWSTGYLPSSRPSRTATTPCRGRSTST